jgi:DNA-binding HxlR family transcriptional regulator
MRLDMVAHDALLPPGRSGCPINMTVEVLGDQWTLVVLRDIVFGDLTHYRELLTNSTEGISTSTLANRLARMVDIGILERVDDPSHAQKREYLLREPGIQLVPLLVELGRWGTMWMPTEHPYTVHTTILADGGPTAVDTFSRELRNRHLHGSPFPGDGITARMTAAFLAALEG